MAREIPEIIFMNLNTASKAELQSSVSSLARRANNRLRALEKAGYTSSAYKGAMKDLQCKKRFREGTKTLSINELRREYAQLRDFLSAKTSTVSGVNNMNRKRYEKAVSYGFTGTEDEFYDMVDKLYTKKVEELYSSNIIYEAIVTGHTDIIQEVVARYETIASNRKEDRGRALIEYLRRSRNGE